MKKFAYQLISLIVSVSVFYGPGWQIHVANAGCYDTATATVSGNAVICPDSPQQRTVGLSAGHNMEFPKDCPESTGGTGGGGGDGFYGGLGGGTQSGGGGGPSGGGSSTGLGGAICISPGCLIAALEDFLCTGSGVVLPNGTYVTSATDIEAPSRSMKVSFTRTYKSNRVDKKPKDTSTTSYIGISSSGGSGGSYSGTLSVENSYSDLNSDLAFYPPEFGPLGFGWYSPYFAKLKGSTFVDGEGQHYPFKMGSDGKYLPMTEHGVALVKTETGYQVVYDSGKTLEFDQDGKLLAIKDAAGRTISLEYDPAGKLEKVLDVTGRTALTFAWDGDLVSDITDFAGRATHFEYDALKNLIRVTGRCGSATEYQYSGHFMTSKTLPSGETFTIGYYNVTPFEGKGIVKAVVPPSGKPITFEYDFINRAIFYSTAFDMMRATYSSSGSRTSTATLGVSGWQDTQKKETTVNRTEVITDEAGNVTTLRKDEWGNVVSKVDGEGNEWKYTYDRALISTATDPLGNVTHIYYNSNKKITKVVQAEGTADEAATIFGYDQWGDIASAERAGSKYAFVNNEFGKPEKITDPLGNVTHLEYDQYGNVSAIVDPLGNRSTYTHDTAGNVLTATDPLGNVTEFTYNSSCKITSVKDPLGNLYSYSYDASGNLARAVSPSGLAVEMAYDSNDKPIAITYLGLLDENGDDSDPADNYSLYAQYDGYGRMTKFTDPEGNVTTYEYATKGCGCPNGGSKATPLKITDPFGNLLENFFDKSGKLITSNFMGYQASISYDAAGRPVSSTDAHGGTSTYEYDHQGRVKAVTDPLGYTSSVTYNAMGLVSSVTDEEGRVTTYTYDALGNLTGVTAPDGGKTILTHNVLAQLTSVTDAEGNRTTFEYDKYGRLVKETRPMGEYAVFAYDNYGRISTKTDAKGQVTSFSYDNLGRTTSISYEDGKTESFGYDAYGRLSTYAGSVSGSYTYDKYGRVLSETVDYGPFTKTWSYTYDTHGNKASFTMPEGTRYDYAYNSLGQILSIASGGRAVGYQYDLERLTGRTAPGGVQTAYTYDAAGRLSGISASSPTAGTVMDHQYTRGPAGDIISRATEHGTYSYSYDSASRVTGATRPGLPDEDFTYDRVGNRTSSADSDTWSYNPNNELVGYGDVSYTYDANGNTTMKNAAGQVAAYTYNAQDQLELVNLPDGRIASYRYDPFGRRVSKTVAGVTTYYLYSQEGLVGEYDATGAPIRTYGWKPGSLWGTNPVFMTEGGSYYYYHNDQLGMPQKMTDEAGNVVWSAVYTVFGGAYVEPASTVTNNLRFPGQYFDSETGLHYNWFRYYDSETGRYITADPIGLAGGMNLYSYVGGNPVSRIDNMGLWWDPAGWADWLDEHIDYAFTYLDMSLSIVEQNTPLSMWMLRFQMSLVKMVLQGYVDLLRLGQGVAKAIEAYQNGHCVEAGAYVFQDVLRAVGLFTLLYGVADSAVNGITKLAGSGASRTQTRFIDGVKIVDKKGNALAEGTVDLKPTLDRIKKGQKYPHENDGSIFRNKDSILPEKPYGYYREYVHPTPGVKGPGPQRIVTGEGGEIYYTPNHYETFIPVN